MMLEFPFVNVLLPIVQKVNRNFLIRYVKSTSRNSFLIGAGKYSELVGSELAMKHFNKVLNSTTDKVTINLRRGLTIHFIAR